MARPLVPKRPARLQTHSASQLCCTHRNYIPDTVQVAVGFTGAIVVDDDVHTLDINATAEDISGDQDTLLERLERRVTVNARLGVSNHGQLEAVATHRSSCASPEWMLMLGKLHETSSLSSSIARATDFTKMTT